MAAVNPTDVVVELNRCTVSCRLASSAGAHGKSAGDSETALVRHVSAINRHAQIAGRDVVGRIAMHADPVHGSAELIYHVELIKYVSPTIQDWSASFKAPCAEVRRLSGVKS